MLTRPPTERIRFIRQGVHFVPARKLLILAVPALLAGAILAPVGIRCFAFPATLARAPRAPMPGASGYRLLRRIDLGGDGSWGYLAFDAPTRRLFISRQNKVIVIDVDSGKVEGEIMGTPGVQGIALAPELGRGFTSNGEKNNVTIFDLSSLKTLETADAGSSPGAIVYDPGSKRVFVMNDVGHSATAIDGATGKVLATIPLRGRPEYAVPDGAGHLYVNIADKNEQQQVNTQDLTATSFWSILPCEAPLGLGMDVIHRRLFIGCTNRMMAVVNADTGKVVSTQATDQGAHTIAFEPSSGTIFSSNGDSGTLTVVHEDSPDNYTLIEDFVTQLHARTMAIDPRNGQIYLVSAAFGETPKPTKENPHPAPPILPGSFVVLVYGE